MVLWSIRKVWAKSDGDPRSKPSCGRETVENKRKGDLTVKDIARSHREAPHIGMGLWSIRDKKGDLAVKDLARSHREALHSGDRREQ